MRFDGDFVELGDGEIKPVISFFAAGALKMMAARGVTEFLLERGDNGFDVFGKWK